MLKKVLFIDRDGTILVEPEDKQIDSFEKFEFLPNCISSLKKIVEELEFELVMVSNQDGLGTASFPEENFHPVQNKMLQILKAEGIVFDNILVDDSFEHQNSPNRKPKTGMLQQYIYGRYNLQESFVIGDRITDVQLAKNLNCKSIFISNEKNNDANFSTNSWKEIYTYLKNENRTASIKRKTNETNISIFLNLDGTGKANINTGIDFFNHMLHQLAKHGNCDLQLVVKGDLEVDEHHTIEDTAIALGEAFNTALGFKKGIERYGFLLPMDDCLAQVAIDFGGRPWLAWDVNFTREKIGEMPTEMFYHFFKSFSDSAKCNLNIQATGNNEHHKIEAIFKAFAKAIKMAVAKTSNFSIPSTKGSL
jgi:imidazoleglycerol-phosphate dehydratase/histidinol-phosphatase